MNQVGTILIFHIGDETQQITHGITFAVQRGCYLDFDQVARLASNDRALRAGGGALRLTGALAESWDGYERMRGENRLERYCYECAPKLRGEANE